MLVGFCGPSSVGKTTIMRRLAKSMAWRLVRVATTRPTRPGEEEKFTVPAADYVAMEREGAFWRSNEYFGNKYGTLQADIDASIELKHEVLMLDWPIGQIEHLAHLASAVFVILPESEVQLANQARACGRADRIHRLLADYQHNYSAATLDRIRTSLPCPVFILTNHFLDSIDLSEIEICQSIQTEILRLSTT